MTGGAAYIVHEMMQKENQRLFDNITNLYILLIDPYISGILTLATLFIRRKKYLKVLSLVHQIEDMFKAIDVIPTYKILTVLGWCAAITIPSGIIAWAIHMYIIHDDIVVHIMWRMCFTPCYILYNYFMSFYTGSLILLYLRFRLINERVKGMYEVDFNAVLKLLPKIKVLHCKLCEVSNRFAKTSDVPILLITTKVYVTTIACVLSFYGMVPLMHSELTVWMSIYWIYFLFSVILSELINIEVTSSITFI